MTRDRDVIADLLPGYDIGAELGRGASGIVYSATHRHLGRAVAVKQLPRAFGADPETKHRFLTEARLLATLDHPHIVPVYDYAEDDGLCVLVLEQLSGGSLWDRICSTPPDAPASCAIVLGICAGLHHAHERGILHRDIKPDNMLFASSGRPKLADFGIAKVLDEQSAHATRAGNVLGTPAYMAPEQAQALPLSPATDLYAIGVVLFELLAGALPFPDEGDPWSVLYRHVHEPPPDLGGQRPDLPPAIAAAVMTTLAKDPAQRHASVETFARELAATATAAWGPTWLEQTGIPLDLPAGVNQVLRAASRATVVLGSVAPAPAPVEHTARSTQVAVSRPESLAIRLATLAQRLEMPGLAELVEQLVLRPEPTGTVAIVGEPLAGTSTLVEALATRQDDLAVLAERSATLVELSSLRSATALVGSGPSLLDGLILVTWAGRPASTTVTSLLRTATNAATPLVVVRAHHDLVGDAVDPFDPGDQGAIDVGAAGWSQGRAVLEPRAVEELLARLDSEVLRSARRRTQRRDLVRLGAIAEVMDRATKGLPVGTTTTGPNAFGASTAAAAAVERVTLRLGDPSTDPARDAQLTGAFNTDPAEGALWSTAGFAAAAFAETERHLGELIDATFRAWSRGDHPTGASTTGPESSSSLVPLHAVALSRFLGALDQLLVSVAADERRRHVLAPGMEVTLQQHLRRSTTSVEPTVRPHADGGLQAWIGGALDDAFAATRTALEEDMRLLARPVAVPPDPRPELTEELSALRDAIDAAAESAG